jgi:hypothetical protein
MTFFVGLHQPSDCRRSDRAFVSVNRLRHHKSNFRVRDWILDMLHSAYSMAWSFHARRHGRNSNDWHEARRFVCRITIPASA